jgi:hypothetical protein
VTRRWFVRQFVAGVLAVVACLAPSPGEAEPAELDATVVRFVAPETGGVRSPRFITARELAFEARIEALADPDRARGSQPYLERHVRAALQRHIAETLLASSRIDPDPTKEELDRQTRAARKILLQRVGGAAALRQAALAEGVGDRLVVRIVRRQARASLYLDRMVAPMLVPSRTELRLVHRQTPFSELPFEQVELQLERYVVSRRLTAALGDYYRNVRARIDITLLSR